MTPPERHARVAPHVVEPITPKADHLGFDLPPPVKVTRSRAVAIVLTAIVGLAVVFVASYLPMRRDRQALEAASKEQEVKTPRVDVVTPTIASSQRSLTLPGTVRALEETVVYSRASGYVRNWHGDIGDKVKEGELLAEIDTPEVDHQIGQARAQLAQAEAGLTLAKANSAFSKQNFERYKKLVPTGVASEEEYEKTHAAADVDEANVTVAQANVEAQRANLQRLAQMKAFARVLAPFSGSITERSLERGQLVNAGNGSPLYRIAATDPVRVFVQVPQDVAPGIGVGAPATVKVREFAGHDFAGQISRAAGALDTSTRTMTVEVQVPNPKSELLIGMYAEVALSLPVPHRVLTVPATALVNDAKGLRVAVVGPADRVRWATVVIERDTGSTIEVASGLEPTDRVVKLATAELTEGETVKVGR
jgi:RND family efflux transporter MFP subunit